MQEKESCQALARELEEERRRALRMEARVEEQLAEFDTEREQLRSRLKKEEAHCCQLQLQVRKAVINSPLEAPVATHDAALTPGGSEENQSMDLTVDCKSALLWLI